MRVLEVNDNDIFGKIFNGYNIMEELNKDSNFQIKQLVICKYSDNENCIKLYPKDSLIDFDYKLHTLENNILSTHSLLSISNNYLKRNLYYKKADIVHYHQIHNSRLSLPELFEEFKNKPSIISLHDPWMMTGRCVHPMKCDKWKNGCYNCQYLNTLFSLKEDNCSELWKIKSLIKDTDIDVIVHSEFMYKMAKKSPYLKDMRIHLINFGLDINKFNFKISKSEAKSKLGILPNSKVIFFREQEALKGTNYVVEALKKLNVKTPITILTCSEKGLLQELEDKYTVIELGTLSEEEILNCYNAADLFLMPSIAESFGMMAIEAMASKVPVIVFDNTALPYTTGAPDYGILVKDRDSKDLKDKIEYYIVNDKEREKRGELSKKFVQSKYDINNYYSSIKKVYKEAYKNQKYKIKNKKQTNTFLNTKDLDLDFNKLETIYQEIFDTKDRYISESSNFFDVIKRFNYRMYERSTMKNKSNINVTKMYSNKKLPLVSIIIPVYNGANYVSLAIDSALRQTYPNKEIIVVNDGSTDKTEKICLSYKDKIRYISKSNGGVSSALNVGIKNMKGSYFSWLSHDDLYYPEKLEKEIKYLLDNDLVDTNTILYSDYSLINGSGEFICDVNFNTYDLNKFSEFSIFKMAINGLTLLIPKKAFEEVGYFDENLRCVQDYQLWVDMINKGYMFKHIPENLSITRIHSSQVTNTSPKVKTEGNKFWLDSIKNITKNKIIKMYDSQYNFYYTLYNFFNGGPYDEALAYCKNKCDIIEKNNLDLLNEKTYSCVVYGARNKEQLLKTLNSIYDQTKEPKTVIAIVKDILKLDSLEKQYRGLKIIKVKSDTELIINLNSSVPRLKTDYITFVRSGDILDKSKNEKQVLRLICSEENVSHTSYFVNDKNGSFLVDSAYLHGFIQPKLINDYEICLSTVMVSRKFLLDNKIRFNENLLYGFEQKFLLDVLKNENIFGIREPLVTTKYNYFNETKNIQNDLNKELRLSNEYSLYKNELDELYQKSSNTYINQREITNNNHKFELSRYEYMLKKEFKIISKIRNFNRAVLFRKKQYTYEIDYNKMRNGKLNIIYYKLSKLKSKLLRRK